MVTGIDAEKTLQSQSGLEERSTLQAILSKAGIRINGDRPWDVQVHDERLYREILARGSLAAGETYVDGWWDCEALDRFFYRVLRHRLFEDVGWSWRHLWNVLRAKVLNLQSGNRSYQAAGEHYDRGNDLFQCMLDDRMVYSCAYWRHADTLEEAQEAKLDLICRKLRLDPGMRVLDIGCGWGGFAEYAAEEYGANVVGITVSEEQARLARQRCANLPVEIRLQDYREVEETFDRVVSVGMFAHVGRKNYRTYMNVVRRCLRDPQGLTLMQTLGYAGPNPQMDPWIEKYIFPSGRPPSGTQILEAAEDFFVLEDWHSFGPDYGRTLMAWADNFESAWPKLSDCYSEQFYRLWRYYLYQCAGSFRARYNQLWEVVLSPEGVEEGYPSLR
jgi:cyclopropane-fatty-acyl-phospholipid synthase